MLFLFCTQHSLFPGFYLPVHVLSYFRPLKGVGLKSYFLPLSFPSTSWFSAVPPAVLSLNAPRDRRAWVLPRPELRRQKGERWLRKPAGSSSPPTAAPVHLCFLPSWCLCAPAASRFPALFTRPFNCIKDRFEISVSLVLLIGSAFASLTSWPGLSSRAWMKMGRSAPLPGFHLASHGARALSSIQLSGTQQRLFWIGILIRFWFSQ